MVIKIIVIVALCVSFARNVQAQDSMRVQRIEYIAGASLAFSLFDYYGFNYLHRTIDVPQPYYRVLQTSVQTAISYFLYKSVGLSSAIAFNVMWWTWDDDLAYFGWAYLLNSFSWEDRTENGFRFPNFESAGYTPIGLSRPPHTPIAKNTLIAQAAVGLLISIAITW